MPEDKNMWEMPSDPRFFANEMQYVAQAYVQLLQQLKTRRNESYPRTQQSPVAFFHYAILQALIQQTIGALHAPEEIRQLLNEVTEEVSSKITFVATDPETMPYLVKSKPSEEP